MVPPARLIRRIPVALLTALAVSVAVGGAFAAGDEAPKSGLDDGYVDVPAPRLGDQGAYQVSLGGAWDLEFGGVRAPTETPWVALNFSWSDGGLGLDAHGASGPVDRLEVSGRHWQFDLATDSWGLVETGGQYDYRSGEARPFLRSSSGEQWDAPEINGNELPQEVQDSGLPVPQSNQGAGLHYRTERYFSAHPHCLLAGPFQGRGLDLDGVVLGGDEWGDDWRTDGAQGCDLDHLGNLWSSTVPWGWTTIGPLGATFRPLGTDVLDGHTVAGFTLRDPHNPFGGVGLDLWLSEDLPYPLRVVTYPRFYEGNYTVDERTWATYDLVAFLPGDEPRVSRGQWTGSWPAWTTVPLQPWGMDEAGVAHPFPASQAYAIAKTQDANTSAFLREFPDAYTAQSSYTEFAGERTWLLTLTDGPHVLELRVTQTQDDQPELNLDPTAPLRMPGPVYTVESERDDESSVDYTSFPTPEEAPRLGPSVGQVLERWRDLGATSEPNTWGMAISRHYDDDMNVVWQPWFTAGAAVFERASTAPCLQPVAEACLDAADLGNGGLAIHEDRVTTESDGTVATRRMYDRDWDGRYGLVAPDETPEQAPKASDTVSAAPSWQPTPRQAAGAGAVGVLAGLVYLLWPAVKAGPTALFSRVHGPQLLEHPVRLRLSQLVHASPGIHFKELRRQSGLANGVLVHHLDKLARSGLVTVKDAGRYRCYFPPNTGAVNGMALAAVKAEGAQKVLHALRLHPGLDTRGLAVATGLGRGTVHYHLQRLQEAGLVRQAPLMPGMQGATWTAIAAS